MSPAIFESHRRTPSGQDPERRKSGSGFLFLNNRFKRAPTTKTTNENATSTPPTPTFGPVKDGYFMKRSDSSRSIPSLVQSNNGDAETPRPMTAMPGREKSFLDNKEPAVTSVAEEKTTPTTVPEEKETPAAAAAATATETAAAQPKAVSVAETAQTAEDDAEDSSSEDEDDDEKNAAETREPQGAQLATRVAILPPRPATPEADKRISYHEDADLHIKVRESNGAVVVYSVRSAALASASRVWKDLLAKNTAPVLELHSAADTASGLDVLFSIAHFKFHELPAMPNVGELYDLALASDKYAATHLLVPFMKDWVVALNRHVLMAGARNDEDKTLVLSWVFGEARWFSRVLAKAAFKSRVGTDGALLDSKGRPWRDQPVSDEVVGMLAAARAEAVEKIIKAVSNPVHRLLNPSCYPGEEVRYCHAGTDDGTAEDCEQLLLGSAIMGLTKSKLWPPPEPAKIKVSAVDLARAYGEVRIRRYQTPGLRFRESQPEGAPVEDPHAKCGFGHREVLDKILNTPAKMAASVVGQLITRAKKSGAFGDELFADLKEYAQDGGAAVAVEGEDLKTDPVHYKQIRVKTNDVVENKTPADDDDDDDEDDESSSESDDE
ncbi:nuclear pore protein [Colletotrichum tabaci]|uniref:Nuclear pore protein n=1 Tax=Colletotrichum tabaci TaxID=1209068 RepID=A0AAV9TVT0_9PEZI